MVTRFSISLDGEILDSFERFRARHKYANRSEAVRDLIRTALVGEQWERGSGDVMGVISLVYDHHQRNLLSRITSIQHDAKAHVVSTTHVHMDHHNCLEIIIARGKATQVRALADALFALRGVKNGALNTASTGRSLH